MVYRSLVRPILFSLPPETAHELALHSLSLVPARLIAKHFSDPSLRYRTLRAIVSRSGRTRSRFRQKRRRSTTTRRARFWFHRSGHRYVSSATRQSTTAFVSLREDQALINRAGFNNDGAAAFARRVKQHRAGCVLGVSIGKSKITPLENATEDYLKSFELVHEVADYIAVNVSSPNTPQLRELQQSEQLTVAAFSSAGTQSRIAENQLPLAG